MKTIIKGSLASMCKGFRSNRSEIKITENYRLPKTKTYIRQDKEAYYHV